MSTPKRLKCSYLREGKAKLYPQTQTHTFNKKWISAHNYDYTNKKGEGEAGV
jgi:hypothetical protein